MGGKGDGRRGGRGEEGEGRDGEEKVTGRWERKILESGRERKEVRE